ncbi:nitroreductase family deazaflavin-dependent oxidoreductase [Nocardia sp. NPDC005998]|uniref:nitroreductase family deazaflavin-dependent oxidoreductase n=1 Tax=Nocardia sp. NPDC005998 TaxID=3156894 RepID=UPI0033B81C1A
MTEYDADGVAAFNVQLIEDFRRNGGQVTLEPLRGQPTVLLHTVGARTGQRRVTPLAYFIDGDRIVVIASKGGAPEHPAWFHNLRAEPQATVEIGTEAVDVVAELLTEGLERQRLYDRMAELLPQFVEYQTATDRVIPVVVLARTHPAVRRDRNGRH